MSYAGSSGSGAALNVTLIGATQGGGPLYVQPATLKLIEDPVKLTYSDGSDGKNVGMGIGPVSSPTGSFTGGYANLQGVLHVEDPGATLAGSTTVYISSHTRAPLITLQNGLSYSAGVTGAMVKLGVNSRNYELALGTYVDDLVLTSSISGSKLRVGKFSTGLGPIVTIPLNTGSSFVGIGQDNPQATLHAGCGTAAPITSSTQVYASNFGDAAIAVSDSTNKVEMAMGSQSGNGYIGSATATNVLLRTNNVNRGVITVTGNLFIGSTNPANYNPETSVLGLTGFPSAAISIAGNKSSDGSIGQVAWYNDSAGVGTRVAAVQVSRATANNNSTMTLSTMNAGALTPSVFIGTTQWVGVLNVNPQAALDITGSLRTSGNVGAGSGQSDTTFLNVGAATTAKSSLRLQPGTAPTVPNDGDLWMDSGQKSLASVAGSLKSNVSGVFLVLRSTTAITGTNVETSLLSGAFFNGTQSLPANLLQLGKVIRITLGGVLSAGAGETLELQVKLGGVYVVDTGAMVLAATSVKSWTADVTIAATGATSLTTSIRFILDTASGTPLVRTSFNNGVAFSVGTAYTLDVTGMWGSNSGSNSLSTGTLISEILN